MPQPPSIEILDAQLTGLMTRARYVSEDVLKAARAIRDRLRRGEDRGVIEQAIADVAQQLDVIEDTGRGRR